MSKTKSELERKLDPFDDESEVGCPLFPEECDGCNIDCTRTYCPSTAENEDGAAGKKFSFKSEIKKKC